MRVHLVSLCPCIFLLVALASLLICCSDEKAPQDFDKQAGFRFGIHHDTTGTEDFIAVTTDENLIQTARAELRLDPSERILHIHGPIARGNGGHNLSWKWHFIPTEWALVESSIEVCDGTPSAADGWIADLPDSVDAILFCPFASYVKGEAP
jgi:hypothetical protein